MNKSILVVDNPNCCNDCQYCEYIQSDEYMWCHLKFRIVKNEMKKPSWCPLKPMPQKIDKVDYFKSRGVDYDFGLSKEIDGYNRCINEIQGEDE